jgi:hypothetical protein
MADGIFFSPLVKGAILLLSFAKKDDIIRDGGIGEKVNWRAG